MKKFDFIALGRAAIDLNALDYNKPMEETRKFMKYVGGSPVNIAINASRLGMKTGFIGKVSNDQHGRFIETYLKEVGVDTSNLLFDSENRKSGLTFTEILSPEECNILMYREEVADLYLESAEISESYIKEARYLLVSGTALSKSPSREATLLSVLLAEKNKIPIIFELDYRPYTWESVEAVNVYYSLVAQKSKLIIGTREEFNYLDSSENKKIVENLFQYSPETIIIKNGIEGAKGYQKNGRIISVKAYQSKVLKTFGAGDSFAAAFLFAYLKEYPLEEAMKFGNAAASIVISKHSSSESMPSLELIKQTIQEHRIIN